MLQGIEVNPRGNQTQRTLDFCLAPKGNPRKPTIWGGHPPLFGDTPCHNCPAFEAGAWVRNRAKSEQRAERAPDCHVVVVDSSIALLETGDGNARNLLEAKEPGNIETLADFCCFDDFTREPLFPRATLKGFWEFG